MTGKDQDMYFYSCVIKCKIDTTRLKTDDIHCSGEYVDCGQYGGYDPSDPCKQTCIQPREGLNGGDFSGEVDEGVQEADTRLDEINTGTRELIYHGRSIKVKCENSLRKKIECKDMGG